MKTILLVDDSSASRLLVSLALKQGGYEVVEASDGIQALQALGSGCIDLVLSDVNMPRMNGFALLDSIQRDERHKGIPVVFLTAETQMLLIERAKTAGAKGWIAKPFNANKMLAALDKLLQG